MITLPLPRADEIRTLYVELKAASNGTPEDEMIVQLARREAARQIVAAHLDLPKTLSPDDIAAVLGHIAKSLAALPRMERNVWFRRLQGHWKVGLRDLAALVEPHATAEGGADREETTSPLALVQAAIRALGIMRDPVRATYLRIGSEAVSIKSEECHQHLAHLVHVTRGVNVSRRLIDDAFLPLLGDPTIPVEDVPTRVGGTAECSLIDLADDTGRVIEITAAGVRILDESPVAFKRPAGSLPLPEPVFPNSPEEAQATLSTFWQLAALDEVQAQAAAYTWLINQKRKSKAYTILIAISPEGTAKTGRATMFRNITDPNKLEVARIPRDDADIVVIAANAYSVVFDNISSLRQSTSDLFCSMATGGGSIKRALYTDESPHITQLSRPIILTSIVDIATQADLLSRSIILRASKPKVTRTDDEVAAAFRELHPRLLGALCYLAHVAMANVDDVAPMEGIRMQQAARFAAAAETAAGFPPGTVARVFAASADDALAAAQDDVFVATALAWATEGERTVVANGKGPWSWEGSASDLSDLLTSRVIAAKGKIPKEWPEDSRWFGRALARHRATLDKLGLHVEIATDGGARKNARVIRFRWREDAVAREIPKEMTPAQAQDFLPATRTPPVVEDVDAPTSTPRPMTPPPCTCTPYVTCSWCRLQQPRPAA